MRAATVNTTSERESFAARRAFDTLTSPAIAASVGTFTITTIIILPAGRRTKANGPRFNGPLLADLFRPCLLASITGRFRRPDLRAQACGAPSSPASVRDSARLLRHPVIEAARLRAASRPRARPARSALA